MSQRQSNVFSVTLLGILVNLIAVRVTGNVLLNKLENQGLIALLRSGQGRMPNIYILPKLINIIEGKKIL